MKTGEMLKSALIATVMAASGVCAAQSGKVAPAPVNVPALMQTFKGKKVTSDRESVV